MVNIYAPNNDSPGFFSNLFLNPSSLNATYIIAGDFNCTLDPNKDRSANLDLTHNKCRTIIHQFIKDLNLRDTWRDRNTKMAIYSCFMLQDSSYLLTSRLLF